MQVARNWREEKKWVQVKLSSWGHLCSLAFVQVLRLCEHIFYPTAKRPLALCNELLILASKFVCPCIYTHRRIIRPDGLSTLVRLPRRTKQIVRLDG